MSDLQKLSEFVEKGNRNEAKRLTNELLAAGMKPLDVVEKGLVPGMNSIGEKFKNNQIFVPEMLIAAARRTDNGGCIRRTCRRAPGRHTSGTGPVPRP